MIQWVLRLAKSAKMFLHLMACGGMEGFLLTMLAHNFGLDPRAFASLVLLNMLIVVISFMRAS